jgi:hypothetical protein
MRLSTLTRLLFLLALPAHAETAGFVVYEAQHHSADELKKAAAEVTTGARLSSVGSKIVVYGTKAQRDAVLKVFGELDHRLRNFVVRLRLAAHGTSERGGASGGVSGSGAAVHVAGAAAESSAGSEQRLTVLDGGTARLYADSGLFPKTVTVHLRAIGQGGANVEIREAGVDAIGDQALVTELDVPLGEWRTLGGVTTVERRRAGEIFGRAHRSAMSSQNVQVRVEAER